MSAADPSATPVHEIERVYLLSAVPRLAPDVHLARIEQGYLEPADDAVLVEGRVRRALGVDGTIRCTHTVKRGEGLVREECEREISSEAFRAAWPRTEGRRITKVRYFVPDASGPVPLEWVVDAFDDLPLVLAEVELPAVDTPLRVPDWLAPFVVREVTEDAAYRNAVLARDGMPVA